MVREEILAQWRVRTVDYLRQILSTQQKLQNLIPHIPIHYRLPSNIYAFNLLSCKQIWGALRPST